MCLSGEVSDKWPPFIELIIFIIFGGLNVGAHYGVYIVSKTKVIDITGDELRNVSHPNSSVFNNFSYGFVNHTVPPEEQWHDLIEFRKLFSYVWYIGALLFCVQVLWLLPNVVKHLKSGDPALLKEPDAHCYYRSVFPVYVMFLILGSVIFDIPIACLTMELLSFIWKGDGITLDEKLAVTKTMVTLSLIGLTFVALYKGMMPLFLWVGNPFCFPCVPLRMLIVLPGGLVVMVMTFAPPMGVAKHGLLTFAPKELQAELGDLANTFFSIGMIFWGVFAVVLIITVICYFKFCRGETESKGCLCC